MTKFRENPQHIRILVNEWIAARLLEYLRIAGPKVRNRRFDESFLSRESDVKIRLVARELPVSAGWHFGSRFPGHPDKDAVYDYLPTPCLLRSITCGTSWGCSRSISGLPIRTRGRPSLFANG